TEKIARRGVAASGEYQADLLDQILVRRAASKGVVALRDEQTAGELRAWVASDGANSSHQGFPVLNEKGFLIGVVTRRDFMPPNIDPNAKLKDLVRRLPKFVYDDCTLREATEHMVNHDVGRLPVVCRAEPTKVIGMLTRSDILSAYRHSAAEHEL